MSDVQVTTVPKELYYHEVAYVRGLEARNAELVAALKICRPWVVPIDDRDNAIERKEAMRQIDAALATAGHTQGSGK